MQWSRRSGTKSLASSLLFAGGGGVFCFVVFFWCVLVFFLIITVLGKTMEIVEKGEGMEYDDETQGNNIAVSVNALEREKLVGLGSRGGGGGGGGR